jgi:hypothetical protein
VKWEKSIKRIDYWTDDIFVLVTEAVGGTSVSTPDSDNRPPWINKAWGIGLPEYKPTDSCDEINNQ